MKMSLDQLKVDSYAAQVSENELTDVKGGSTPLCVAAYAAAATVAAAAVTAAGAVIAATINQPSCVPSTTTVINTNGQGQVTGTTTTIVTCP